METAKDRLLQVYKYFNTNANDIEAKYKELHPKAKFSKQNLYNIESGKTKSLSAQNAEVINSVFPEADITWLTSGKGTMIQKAPRQIQPNKEVDTVDFIDLPDDDDDFEAEETENAFGNKFVKLPNGQYMMYMPLFEWDVAASLLDVDGDTRHPDYDGVEQHVTIVDKPQRGKYSAFRVKGGSMEGTEPGKFIPDGSIVWGRELQRIHWKDHLRISKRKLWIVGSTEFGRPTLKEITEHQTDTATIVVDSWNPSLEYAHNVPISLNTVKMLYYVIKVESSVV